MAKFSETVFQSSAPRVDADAGVLYGVKLIGLESRNNRRYKSEGLSSAVSLYEGRKIYVDHPDPSNAGDRSLRDWAGTIQKARFEPDGIYGDVKLRKAGEYFEGIIEAATEFPKDVGFSHVAEGNSHFEGDTEIVESIREVFSVDLVTDPATTAGFFESHRKPKPRTVKAAIESLPDSPTRTKLIEMVGSGQIPGDLSIDADAPIDPVSHMAVIINELIKQLGEALNALAMKKDAPPPVPAAPPAPEEDMAEQDKKQQDEKAAAFESLQRENAELKAKSLLLESGREASQARIKALAGAAEADQKELLESWPVLAEGERPARSPAALVESHEGSTDFDFSQPGSFAARYR